MGALLRPYSLGCLEWQGRSLPLAGPDCAYLWWLVLPVAAVIWKVCDLEAWDAPWLGGGQVTGVLSSAIAGWLTPRWLSLKPQGPSVVAREAALGKEWALPWRGQLPGGWTSSCHGVLS